jgi:drug/metabolite transporter (DMT)-like permease
MRSAAAAPRLSTTSRGYLICGTGTLIWSTTGILIRYLTQTYQMPPLSLAVWRDLTVSLGLAAGLALVNPARLRFDRAQLGFLALYGFVVALFNTAWTFSVALNGAAVATVLVYSAPAFSTLIGRRLFSENLSIFKITVILVILLGCALVAKVYHPASWQLNPVGVVTGMVSGLMFALYSLMGKLSNRRGLNAWTSLMVAFGFGTLFLFIFNLTNGAVLGREPLADLLWLGGSISGWGILILLGLGPTIGGYGLYTLSLDYLPMGVASLIATMEPVFTTFLAYLLLGERMTGAQILGSAIILGCVITLRLKGD